MSEQHEQAPWDAITEEMDAVFAAVAVERNRQDRAMGGHMATGVWSSPQMFAHALADVAARAVKALRRRRKREVYEATVRLAAVSVALAERTKPEEATAANPAVVEPFMPEEAA